jgi:hypothetical protein
MLCYQFSRSLQAAIQLVVHGRVFQMHKRARVARSGRARCGCVVEVRSRLVPPKYPENHGSDEGMSEANYLTICDPRRREEIVGYEAGSNDLVW